MTEWQEQLARLIARAPLAQTFGMRLSFDDVGNSLIDLPYNPALDHAFDGLHGGVMATLLDSAGWSASAALHPNVWVATAEFTSRLLRQAVRCDLRAEGRVIQAGKRLDVVEMKVMGTDDDKLYATGSGTIVVLDIPFGEDSG